MTGIRNWSKINIKFRKIKGNERVNYNVDVTLPNGKRIRQRFYIQLDAQEFAEGCRVAGVTSSPMWLKESAIFPTSRSEMPWRTGNSKREVW